MPPLRDTLDPPRTWPRWTMLAAAAALAAIPAVRLIHDTAAPDATRFTWDVEAIAANRTADPPAEATAHLPEGTDYQGATLTADLDGTPVTALAAWDPDLTVTEIRIEYYTDRHGTGVRLGATAWSDTAETTRCLTLALTGDTAASEPALTLCTRADNQPQSDTYPGRTPTGDWEPTHLYLTQTSRVDLAAPARFAYYGIGADTGIQDESGIWGPNMWDPMDYSDGPYHDYWRWSCPGAADTVDLTDDPVYGEHHALPVPGADVALPVPACTPVDLAPTRGGLVITAEPDTDALHTPLSGWSRYNDATLGHPVPLRTAFTVDLRTCDTDPEDCDTGAHEWMTELLDP